MPVPIISGRTKIRGTTRISGKRADTPASCNGLARAQLIQIHRTCSEAKCKHPSLQATSSHGRSLFGKNLGCADFISAFISFVIVTYQNTLFKYFSLIFIVFGHFHRRKTDFPCDY
jgi:hypothetical protein